MKSLINKVSIFLELVRPVNIVLVLLAVAISFLILREFPGTSRALLVFLAVGLIFAGGNYLNDFYDREVDRKAHPKRPIPSSRIAPEQVERAGIALLGAGILSSGLLGFIPLLFGLVAGAGLYVYNRWLKGLPLIGNLAVAGLAGLVFVFVGASVQRTKALLWPALLAFLFHLGREIIKDLEDLSADRAFGLRTLPHVIGERKSISLARAIIVLLVLSSIMPFLTAGYGLVYLLMVILLVDVPLLFLVFSIHENAESKEFGRASSFMKYDIFVALLALYFGRS